MDLKKFLESLESHEIEELKQLLNVENIGKSTPIDRFIVENPQMSFRLKNALADNKHYLPKYVEEIESVHLLRLRNLGQNSVKEFQEVFAKFKGKTSNS